VKADAAFFIAIRYLLGRAKEGGRYLRGAAAGIAISLIPIVVTLIVADGMIRGITDRYVELGTGHLQIHSFEGTENWDEIISRFEDSSHIRGVWEERYGLGVLVGKKGKTGATIRSLDSSFWQDRGSARFIELRSGSLDLENERELLLGESLAESVGAETGDTVRIMTIREGSGGRSIPRMTPFIVKGIVSSGYRELDALWCITNLEGAERILSSGLSSSYLIVKTDDPYEGLERSFPEIFRVLSSGYGVYTWKQLMQSQYSSYESTRQLLLFIMALIVLVAAVNVSSATSMLVIERQRDIAVLKAAGAGPEKIRRIFIWGAFLTGLSGALAGGGAGLLIGYFINSIVKGLESVLSLVTGFFYGGRVRLLDPGYYLENIPIIIDWSAVFAIIFATVLCSVIAALLPAMRAGRLKPLDLLRKY
jgi:lipoprotein-releasing system permease protein